MYGMTRSVSGLRVVVSAALALVASAQTPLCGFAFDDAAAQTAPSSGALSSACYQRLDGTAGWQPSAVGSNGTGSAIVFSNFGTPVVATQNGTVGISFCLNHTLGFSPTEFRYDLARGQRSPRLAVSQYSQPASSLAYVALPNGTSNVTTAVNAVSPWVRGLAFAIPPVTALSNSAGGACFTIHALLAPGETTYPSVLTTNTYGTGINGAYYVDNVVISGALGEEGDEGRGGEGVGRWRRLHNAACVLA